MESFRLFRCAAHSFSIGSLSALIVSFSDTAGSWIQSKKPTLYYLLSTKQPTVTVSEFGDEIIAEMRVNIRKKWTQTQLQANANVAQWRMCKNINGVDGCSDSFLWILYHFCWTNSGRLLYLDFCCTRSRRGSSQKSGNTLWPVWTSHVMLQHVYVKSVKNILLTHYEFWETGVFQHQIKIQSLAVDCWA